MPSDLQVLGEVDLDEKPQATSPHGLEVLGEEDLTPYYRAHSETALDTLGQGKSIAPLPRTSASSSDLLPSRQKPRSTAEGLLTEQVERRQGMPLVLAPDRVGALGTSPGVEVGHHTEPVPQPTVRVSSPAPAAPKIEQSFWAPGQETGEHPELEPPSGPEFEAQRKGVIDAMALGTPTIARGLGDVFLSGSDRGGEERGVGATPATPAEQEAEKKQVLRGATELMHGTGTATTGLLGEAAVAKPLATAAWLASGYGASKGTEKLVHGKVSPETEDLLTTLAMFIPQTAAMAAGLHGARVDLPEMKGAAVGVRGAGAGFTVTPEGVTVGGKVGPFQGSKTFSRGGQPSAAVLEPPTIEGQVAAPDPTASALAQSKADDLRAARVAKGMPPEPVPQGPPLPPDIAQGHLSPETVSRIATAITQLPPNLRAQGIIEAHENLTKVLLQQGKLVGPDGQLHVIENEKQASSAAQKIINDEVSRQDKAAEESAKAKPAKSDSSISEGITAARARGKQSGKLEVLGETELPGVESANAEDRKSGQGIVSNQSSTGNGSAGSKTTVPDANGKDNAESTGRQDVSQATSQLTVLGEEHLLKKGDKVTLPGGESGTVHYISDSIARVEVPKPGGGTKRVSIPPAKLKAASSETPAETKTQALTDVKKSDVVFARHGSTKLDQAGGNETVAGWSDEPLDDRGKESAAKIAEHLKDSGVTKIVSSDLPRAKQTAEIVGKELGLPVETDERLRPQRIPETEGKQVKDIQHIRDHHNENPDVVPEGGESKNQFIERQDAALADVKKLVEQGEKPLVVTHSTNLEHELGEKPEPGEIVGKNLTPKKEKANDFNEQAKQDLTGFLRREPTDTEIAQRAKHLEAKAAPPKPIQFEEHEITPTKAGLVGKKIEEAKPTGAATLADAVYQKLKVGESLGNVTALNKLAEEHFGSSRTSGEWTPKDAFDAMEAGVNKHLLDRGKDLMAMPAEEGLAELRDLMGRITSQGTRTEEQIKNQQFSTPPTESYVAAKVAGLKPSDVVLEPSAGNGGLAVWPKSIGAETHVNEISDRRQEMLKHVGFDKPTAHDGELINALLDQKVKPTVVLMNPPFSASTLKSYEAKNRNQYGFNHVDQALQRLEDGGRLVAILGGGQANEPNGGASISGGSSGEWFDKVAKKYNVRANVRVNGKEYQKYGTAFATRIIVIDKDGPTPISAGKDWRGSVVNKNVDTLEEAYNALKQVAESRPQLGGEHDATRSNREVATTRPGSPERAGEREAASSRSADQDLGPASAGIRSGRSPENLGKTEPADRLNGSDRSAGIVRPGETGERVPLHQSGDRSEKSPEAIPAESVRGSSENPDRERPVQLPEVEGLTLGKEKSSAAEQEDSSAYVTYKPTLKGPTHPGSIVESKTMATVPLPDITYKPSLPGSVIKEGKLSAVQLEAISIAGQQNDIVLPSGHRASALIGDGTGVGKGRIGAGVLWDNFSKGRKRLVWVSEKWDLMEDAKRDFNGIGAGEMAKNIKAFQKYNVTDPIDHEGVLFTTYALMRSGDKKGNTRINQLQKWLRGNDEANGAYVLFDESHNLKNAVTGSAQTPPSEIGQTVKKLLEQNPKLRTASLSATAATDVMNLGYLDRLGLWGPGTSFPNGFNEFAAQISGGGISAMEMVARELKAQGKYLSRTLSFKGVTYQELEHKLTADQKELYRTAVKAWGSVVQQAEGTIKETTNGGPRAVARFMSLFYGAQLRFFNVLLTTLKIPTAIEDANKALTDGKSVVITLVNTNEAAQNREKNKERPAAGDDDDPPDYDFGPAEMLTDLVREHYPTQQYKDDVDSEGRMIKVPVVDADGNPVQNPEAVKQRDALLKQVKADLKLPKNPLDILIDSFGGSSKVAELTGRKERFDEATGKFVKRGDQGVKRDQINLSEMRAFQAGKKRVAILSNAAGTGISLHADNNAANQQKRHHITLQMGWSADKAMQMLGRTHRANQIHPPEYNSIVSDLGGEKRFSATIAKRLGSLGALSKGQKTALSGSEAMDKVNFESDQGKKATNTFYRQLLDNRPIPGTEDASVKQISGMSILRDLRVLKRDPQTGIETVPDADRTNVTRLLNRLLALDPDIQNAVYDYFYDIFQATVQEAVENGNLDTGVKELPGDEFSVKEQRAISRDPKTGAETFYYPIEAKVKTNRLSPQKVEKGLKSGKEQNARLLRNDKGKLIFAKDAKPIVHADGRTSPASYIVTPANGTLKKVEDYTLHSYEDVAEKATETIDQAKDNLQRHKNLIVHYRRMAESNSRYQSYLDDALAESSTYEKAVTDAEKSANDPHGAALEEWKKQYEAAPEHDSEEHHLIGGAVLRWWNQIREAANEHLHIYTAVDSKTGKRVVGVEVPESGVRQLLDRISGSKSTVSSGQLSTDVLKNNLNYTLEQNVQVRKGRVGGKAVIQVIPPSEAVAANLKRLGVIYERGVTPVYYVPSYEEFGKLHADEKVLNKVLDEYPIKPEESIQERLMGESGAFTPSALKPSTLKSRYQKAAEEIIGKAGLTKYFDLSKIDPEIADTLHLVDNAPRYFREKAQANLKNILQGLSEEQVRLASLMADSDSRDYLESNKPEEYERALSDPQITEAVQKFAALQKELSEDRISLGWPVRRSLSVQETESGEFEVVDRDGNVIEDQFDSRGDALEFAEQEGQIEPHLKRTYPEHTRNPLPAETSSGPYTGTFNRDKGLRPPKMDKKSREMSAEYHYQHGSKDFSGYLESFAQVKEALLKQRLFDELRERATEWKVGTAQPPEIEYQGKTYYRPDLALQMRRGKEKNVLEYGIYDPSRGEKFLIKAMPSENSSGWSTLSTGKPGIGPKDRLLAPKLVVDTLEKYDASRGGDGPSTLRRFFQEQIVGLFGPAVHVANIVRRVGQATGQGTFDPRSWNDIAKVILSPELRARVQEGVDDSTIDMLTRYGDYTDWRDIGNLNAYIGGNLNPLNWIRAFGKGVLFDPKFMKGWGGLDPKARVVVADYFKAHYPEMSEREVADAVNDGFGNYNRANWTERQRKIAKFTLFPGWDSASFKWFIRHPWVTAIAPALAVLAINLALHALGKNKDDDEYDSGYIHWGDRKFRSGLIIESMAHEFAEPLLSAGEAYLKHEDIGAGAVEGFSRGGSGLAGTLAGPTVQMVANQLFNRKFAGGESEIVNPEDKYTPGTWAPNVDIEKRISYTYLKGLPAVNRFIDSKGTFDWMQGMGSIFGATNYKYGAEERLKANEAKARDYSKVLSSLAERDPEATKDFVSNPTRSAYLMFNGDLSVMTKDLKEIDKEKERVNRVVGMADSRKQEIIANLDQARKQLLRAADAVDDLLIQAKLRR